MDVYLVLDKENIASQDIGVDGGMTNTSNRSSQRRVSHRGLGSCPLDIIAESLQSHLN